MKNPQSAIRPSSAAQPAQCCRGGTATVRQEESAKPELGAPQTRVSMRRAVNLCLVAVAFSLRASAQYSVAWHTSDGGGGGTATNGPYFLSGTIGQPDAGGAMTNGLYSLAGVFWSFVTVVQTPGAPALKIAPAPPGQVTISWTPDTPGYRLQQTLAVSPANWANSPSSTNNPVTVPINSPAKFYRLIRP